MSEFFHWSRLPVFMMCANHNLSSEKGIGPEGPMADVYFAMFTSWASCALLAILPLDGNYKNANRSATVVSLRELSQKSYELNMTRSYLQLP
jgi:hypothetical protein